jgi:hypothetical protein
MAAYQSSTRVLEPRSKPGQLAYGCGAILSPYQLPRPRLRGGFRSATRNTRRGHEQKEANHSKESARQTNQPRSPLCLSPALGLAPLPRLPRLGAGPSLPGLWWPAPHQQPQGHHPRSNEEARFAPESIRSEIHNDEGTAMSRIPGTLDCDDEMGTEMATRKADVGSEDANALIRGGE